MYHKGDPWGDGKALLKPGMMVDVPWDGSYPWRLSGVKKTFPNGDEFEVYIDPSVPVSYFRVPVR